MNDVLQADIYISKLKSHASQMISTQSINIVAPDFNKVQKISKYVPWGKKKNLP